MNIVKETLSIHKHFLVIDSPIPFTLSANNGTDEVYRMAGAWRIDLWKLLTKEYFKQYPVFILELIYDSDLLNPGQTITVRESDIDLGEGIAGVNGQDVHITNFSDMPTTVLPDTYPVTNELDSSQQIVPLEVNVKNYDDFQSQKKNTLDDLGISTFDELKTFFESHIVISCEVKLTATQDYFTIPYFNKQISDTYPSGHNAFYFRSEYSQVQSTSIKLKYVEFYLEFYNNSFTNKLTVNDITFNGSSLSNYHNNYNSLNLNEIYIIYLE